MLTENSIYLSYPFIKLAKQEVIWCIPTALWNGKAVILSFTNCKEGQMKPDAGKALGNVKLRWALEELPKKRQKTWILVSIWETLTATACLISCSFSLCADHLICPYWPIHVSAQCDGDATHPVYGDFCQQASIYHTAILKGISTLFHSTFIEHLS